MKVLLTHQQDPEQNPNVGQRSSHRIHDGTTPFPRDVQRQTWDYPVFDQSGDGKGHKVLVRYERDLEHRPEAQEDDALILTLTDEARHSFKVVMRKKAEQHRSLFAMASVEVSTAEGIMTFDADKNDVLKDSEILTEMEAVIERIVVVLEQHVIDRKRRTQILGSLRQLMSAKEGLR